jgi:hypothetical protein
MATRGPMINRNRLYFGNGEPKMDIDPCSIVGAIIER